MKAPILGISRHRFLTDGDGITTLVAFYGCPLDCRYCANPQCKHTPAPEDYYTPKSLLEAVAADNLYYRATNGGITFGGGGPALQSRFIAEFRRICPPEWHITVETSLNVPREHIEWLLPVVDRWIVDIKDCNDAIYTAYTGKSNAQAMENLSRLLADKGADRITVRVPLIAGYNTKDDVAKSVAELRCMGLSDIEEFAYRTAELSEPDDEIATGAADKRICEQLKAVRIRVAMVAGIKYKPQYCPHQVCATGSCPACEAEAAELSRQIFDHRKPVCVDGIVSRQHLVGNYRFVFYNKNDGGGLFGATPDCWGEIPKPLKPSQSDNPSECASQTLAASVSSADSDTPAPCEDEYDTILERFRRFLQHIERIDDDECYTGLEQDRMFPERLLTGMLLPPEQKHNDENDKI